MKVEKHLPAAAALGAFLRSCRLRKGLSVRGLATMLDEYSPYVRNLERGAAVVHLDQTGRFAQALALSPEERRIFDILALNARDEHAASNFERTP